jgi:chorismate mutase
VDKTEVRFTSERTTMQHTRLTKLSANKLHNLLHKRYKSPARIAEIKQWVANRKKAINTARVEKQVIQKRWAKIIRPLSREIKEARSAKIYHEGKNGGLYSFFVDYLDFLIELRGQLELQKNKSGNTPHKRNIEHWTDWVDVEVAESFIDRYNNIPYASKNSSRRPIFKRGE